MQVTIAMHAQTVELRRQAVTARWQQIEREAAERRAREEDSSDVEF